MEAAGASSDTHTRRGRWLVAAIAALTAAFIAAPMARAMPLAGDPLASTRSAPAVQSEFSRPSSAGATVGADINAEGSETHYYIQYGSSTQYGGVVPASPADIGSGSSFARVRQSILNLQPLHTYHWRAVATNAGGTTVGADQMFVTPPPTPQGAPGVSTGQATDVTTTSATLNGTVDPNNSATVYHFEYGTSTAYGTNVSSPDAPAGGDTSTHALSQKVSGLKAGTTYHFRIVATSAGGTSDGADRTFRTTKAAAPPAVAASVTRLSITPNKFKLSGRTVNHHCVAATRKNQKHRACRRPVALRVGLHLNLAASVKFAVQRILSGRLVGRRCVAPTHSNRGHRACFRLVSVRGSFTRKMNAGTRRSTWNGRIGGHALGAGWYYLGATPIAKGHRSKQDGALFLFKP